MDDSLVSPGFCVACQCHVSDAMTVALIEVGSGPGGLVEACVKHAREYATRGAAPQWLRDDIARLDARRTE